MPNNTGFLLIAGLGALVFLGRGGAAQKPDAEIRPTTGGGGGGSILPAFDIQGYIDDLFGYTATAPAQPPIQYFFPTQTVVTGSGVPAVVHPGPELVTDTTKVQIGGEGGRTVVASSLAIIRSEQVAQQEFAAAAHASLRTAPEGATYFYAATLEANRIEAERMKKVVDAVMARNRAAQAESRQEQEDAAKVLNESRPPTINYDASDEEGLSFGSTAGQAIEDPYGGVTVESIDVDFTPAYSETFVLSGGMDSPMVYASEDEQPSTAQPAYASEDEQPSFEPTRYSGATIQSQYDIGF